MTDRYSNKYVAFIDGLYIIELCDTNNIIEFFNILDKYENFPGFVAYVNGIEIQPKFKKSIDKYR